MNSVNILGEYSVAAAIATGEFKSTKEESTMLTEVRSYRIMEYW